MRLATLALSCALTAACVTVGELALRAQAPVGFVSVGGSRLTDANGVGANAQVCAQAVDAANNPTSITVGGGGVTTVQQVCTNAVNGVWQMYLPNTLLSTPKYAGFAMTATDNVSGAVLIGPGYGHVQPTSDGNSTWCKGSPTVCNFDLLPPQFLPQYAQILQGPAGATGATGANGTLLTGGQGLLISGDSIDFYTGASTTATAYATLLSKAIGGALNNVAIGQRYITDEPLELLFAGTTGFNGSAVAYPTQANNPIYLEGAGKNDGNGASQTGQPLAPAIANAQAALMWTLPHRASNNIVKATAATASGTWTADSFLPSKTGARASTTQGSQLTFSVTTYGSSALIVGYRSITGNGGTASVTIDGTVQATGIVAQGNSNSTIGGISVQAATGTLFANAYPVAGGTHTVVVTVTSATSSSNLIAITDVIGNMAGNYIGAPNAWVREVTTDSSDGGYGAVNLGPQLSAAKQAIATSLASYNYNVHWAPLMNVPFAGAFNVANYIGNQSSVSDPDGLSCAGSTSDPVHPNDCGHKQMFLALATDMGLQPKDGTNLGLDGISPNAYLIPANSTLPCGSSGAYLQNGATLTLPSNCSDKMLLYVFNADSGATSNIVGGPGVVSYAGPASLNPYEGFMLANVPSGGQARWFRVDAPLYPTFGVQNVSAAHVVGQTDQVLLVSGGAPITLPSLFTATHKVTIFNADGYASTVVSGGGNSLSVTVPPRQSVVLFNNQTFWFVEGSPAFLPVPNVTVTAATPTSTSLQGIALGTTNVAASYCNNSANGGTAIPAVKSCLAANFNGGLVYLPLF